MISIDTNIVLRRLLHDDPEQAKKAAKLIEHSGAVLITDVVLAETVWVLTGKKYRVSKEDIVRAITSLVEEPNVVFESKDAVWAALCDFAGAKTSRDGVGLADALIVNKAKVVADHLGIVFNGHYTFDVQAQALPGTKKPSD